MTRLRNGCEGRDDLRRDEGEEGDGWKGTLWKKREERWVN